MFGSTYFYFVESKTRKGGDPKSFDIEGKKNPLGSITLPRGTDTRKQLGKRMTL